MTGGLMRDVKENKHIIDTGTGQIEFHGFGDADLDHMKKLLGKTFYPKSASGPVAPGETPKKEVPNKHEGVNPTNGIKMSLDQQIAANFDNLSKGLPGFGSADGAAVPHEEVNW